MRFSATQRMSGRFSSSFRRCAYQGRLHVRESAGWGQAIVEASLTGKITPNQASALMQALMAQVRLVEADELASRLDAIERQVNRTK
jgi:hypothetical protein